MSDGWQADDVTQEEGRPVQRQPRRLAQRRSIRRVLLAILLWTLLPLALFTIFQGYARIQNERSVLATRLAEAAVLTAFSEQNSVRRAQNLLSLMSSSSDIVGSGVDVCNARLEAIRNKMTDYSHFSLVDAEGMIICASDPRAIGQKVNDRPFWAELKAGGGFAVAGPLEGRFSGGKVIWAIEPRTDSTGKFVGAITASINVSELRKLLRARQATNNAAVAIIDGAGRPVVSSVELPWNRLPVTGRPGDVHVVADKEGRNWTIGEAPVHVGSRPDNSLILIYAALRPQVFGGEMGFLFGYFALPILAIFVTSAAIWIGTNRAILQWISELRQLAGRVGRGDYRVPSSRFAAAPTELRGLAAELARTARLIAERDRTLNEALLRQKALTHELNHRVRNNLQVIGSFLALRTAQVNDPAATRAISEARLHVGLLSAVYRLLYDDGELSSLPLERLFPAILPLLRRELGPNIQIRTEADAGGAATDIDAAIPLALWSLHAILLLGGGREAPGITGVLHLEETETCLLFKKPNAPPRDADDRISSEMIGGLARQIGGTVGHEQNGDIRTIRLSWSPGPGLGGIWPAKPAVVSSTDPVPPQPPPSLPAEARS